LESQPAAGPRPGEWRPQADPRLHHLLAIRPREEGRLIRPAAVRHRNRTW